MPGAPASDGGVEVPLQEQEPRHGLVDPQLLLPVKLSLWSRAVVVMLPDARYLISRRAVKKKQKHESGGGDMLV